jgi:murein DD-endopeptidase MepM/ murein hydrolase activator NlpD
MNPSPLNADSTSGMCSPITKNIQGNVFTIIKCTQDKREFKQNLEETIGDLFYTFDVLHSFQIDFLQDAISPYIRDSSEANWELVKSNIGFAAELIRSATEALLAYRVRIQGKSPDSGISLITRLNERGKLLQQVLTMETRPQGFWLQTWLTAYKIVVEETRLNIAVLHNEWDIEVSYYRMHWPVFGQVTSKFRNHSSYGNSTAGIEMAVVEGSEIRAASFGYVEAVGESNQFGKTILIGNEDPNDHEEPSHTGGKQFYANVGTTSVKKGDFVDRGDVITKYDENRHFKDKGFFFAALFYNEERKLVAKDPLEYLTDDEVLSAIIPN